jgi:proline iminopeptidase
MVQLADDAVALADRLGIDRFSVLGHSYGGFIGQELAIRHPARVDRLVLVTTTPGQPGRDEDVASLPPGPDVPAALAALFGVESTSDADFEALLQRMLPHYFHRLTMDDVAPLITGTSYSSEASHAGFAVLAAWSSVDRLHEIACPTLVIAGRHDVITSWPQAEHRIAPRIPDAELVIFEHSGHFPWLEEPDAFFATVRGWLQR